MQKKYANTQTRSPLVRDAAAEKIAALHEGLANMAVDSLYPSAGGLQIATSYAEGKISREEAVAQMLQLHGLTVA